MNELVTKRIYSIVSGMRIIFVEYGYSIADNKRWKPSDANLNRQVELLAYLLEAYVMDIRTVINHTIRSLMIRSCTRHMVMAKASWRANKCGSSNRNKYVISNITMQPLSLWGHIIDAFKLNFKFKIWSITKYPTLGSVLQFNLQVCVSKYETTYPVHRLCFLVDLWQFASVWSLYVHETNDFYIHGSFW